MSGTVVNLTVYRAQRVMADSLSDRSALRVLGGLNRSLAASLLSAVLEGGTTLQAAADVARRWLAAR